MIANLKNKVASPTTPLFLSFLLTIIFFADTTLRLIFSYALGADYPLPIDLKPMLFIGQIALSVYFIAALFYTRQFNSRIKNFVFLSFQLLLVVIAFVLFVESEYGGPFGFALAGGSIDIGWLLLFWLGPALSALWIFAASVSRRKVILALVFFLLFVAFLIKPFERLYFWTQTYLGLVLPYELVVLGTFGPLLVMFLALCCVSGFFFVRFKRKDWRLSKTSRIFLFASILAVVLPFFLENVKEGLPNMIVRTISWWSLGYDGFGWFAVSIYFFSFVLYIFMIKLITLRLNHSLSSRLMKLGALSLAWNGVSIFFFGYSSIAANILSLNAIAAGLLIRWNTLNNSHRIQSG